MKFLLAYILAFTFTVLIEGVIIFLLFRKLRFVYYSLLMNMLTNPAANLVTYLIVRYGGLPYLGTMAAVEIMVFLIEAILINKLLCLPWKRSVLLSLLLNATTAAVGLLM